MTGQTHGPTGRRHCWTCASGRVNVLFTADLFNEGIDLPSVDTVLFLRPTESATVFLQQLGRGLRLAPNKPVLTALDFVGHQRKEFRFDVRYRALTGATRRGLAHQVEQGFPFLPSGSQIILDRQTQQLVLENIRTQLSNRWQTLVSELRSCGDIDLAGFLHESGVELADVVRVRPELDPAAARLRAADPRRAGRGASAAQAGQVAGACRRQGPRRRLSDGARRRRTAVRRRSARPSRHSPGCCCSRFGRAASSPPTTTGLASLRAEPAVRDEIRSVVDLAFDNARHVTAPAEDRLQRLNLRVHARYQREEILAALGHATLSRVPSTFREGVLRSTEWNLDAFLITLKKSDTDFSPTTMYRDYAISPDLFHWESQSTTSVDSPTGQRYLHHRSLGSSILLFVRDGKTNEMGTEPYMFLGPATYVSHTGDRPIAITWKLDHPMPLDVFTAARVAAG